MSTLNSFGNRWNPYTPSRKRFSNGLAHNKSKDSKVSGSWAEIGGVHTDFSRPIFPFASKDHEGMAESGHLKLESCPQIWDFPKPCFRDVNLAFRSPVFEPCRCLQRFLSSFFGP